MRRLTTPRFEYESPVDIELIDKIRVRYQQGDINLTKYKEDLIFEDNKIIVNLTQEETFNFSDKELVDMQIQIITTSGKSLVSTIGREDMFGTLFEETYGDEV